MQPQARSWVKSKQLSPRIYVSRPALRTDTTTPFTVIILRGPATASLRTLIFHADLVHSMGDKTPTVCPFNVRSPAYLSDYPTAPFDQLMKVLRTFRE
jgi:hypothetical protein